VKIRAATHVMPGLSLITAAIVNWNKAYLVQRLRAQRAMVLDDFLAHVTPLGWELGRAIVGAHELDTLQPARCATHRLPETP
jgi:hypothetical protein